MTKQKKYDKEYWDMLISKVDKHHYMGVLNEYKNYCYNEILKNYDLKTSSGKILITDLFDEAFDCPFMFDKYYSINNSTIGIDISKKVIDKVKVKYPKANIVCCDVRNLPFEDDYFDLIISPSTLDHFPKKDLIKSLHELKRVSKKDGIMIITLSSKQNIWLSYYLIKLLKLLPYDMYLYSKKEVIDVCEEISPQKIRLSGICHLPLQIITTRIFNLLKVFSYETRRRIFKFIENQKYWVSRFMTCDQFVIIMEK